MVERKVIEHSEPKELERSVRKLVEIRVIKRSER